MVIAAARCCISHHRQCVGQYLISACCPAHTGSVLGLVSDWAVMTYLSMRQFGFEPLNLRRLPQKDIASRWSPGAQPRCSRLYIVCSGAWRTSSRALAVLSSAVVGVPSAATSAISRMSSMRASPSSSSSCTPHTLCKRHTPGARTAPGRLAAELSADICPQTNRWV